jgi:hypothetical protein
MSYSNEIDPVCWVSVLLFSVILIKLARYMLHSFQRYITVHYFRRLYWIKLSTFTNHKLLWLPCHLCPTLAVNTEQGWLTSSGVIFTVLFKEMSRNWFLVLVDSKEFWRWCVTLRITRFLDFVHRLHSLKTHTQKNTTFRKLDLFCRIWGFHSGGYEEYHVLWCDAV